MATSRILGLLAVATLVGIMPANGQQVSKPANRDRRLITAEEIDHAQVNTAYEAVEKVRPEFLRRTSRIMTLGGGAANTPGPGSRNAGPGGAGSPTSGGAGAAAAADPSQDDATFGEAKAPQTATVFVDGTNMGDIEELKRVQANMVEEIRYLSGPDAQTKYGPRFPAGVIEVTLKTH